MATTIEQAIKDLQAGKMVVVVDDASRENEGIGRFDSEFENLTKRFF